jgi:hypothetical protein
MKSSNKVRNWDENTIVSISI